MAEDPINQQQFEEDVMAAAAANGGESFANMGDMGSGFKMPSVDEVWKLIQQMEGISDEEKENLRDSLFNPEGATAEDFLKRYAAHESMGHTKSEYMTFFAMIAIVLLVFGTCLIHRNTQAPLRYCITVIKCPIITVEFYNKYKKSEKHCHNDPTKP